MRPVFLVKGGEIILTAQFAGKGLVQVLASFV